MCWFVRNCTVESCPSQNTEPIWNFTLIISFDLFAITCLSRAITPLDCHDTFWPSWTSVLISIIKLWPGDLVSGVGQQNTVFFCICNISFTLLFALCSFSLLSFDTLFIMLVKWYQFLCIVRRWWTNTHTHTHTHLCQPCSVKAPPVYGKCVFLSSVGLDQVMQLVLVSCPWPCISTTERDREQCSVGRRGRAVTEMTQRSVAG